MIPSMNTPGPGPLDPLSNFYTPVSLPTGLSSVNSQFGRNLSFMTDPRAYLGVLAERSREFPPTQVHTSKPQAAPAPTPTSAPPLPPPTRQPSTPRPQRPQQPLPPRTYSGRSDVMSSRFEAARQMYESELVGFRDIEQRGGYVDPISRKRALQRYNNELGRLEATDQRERSSTDFRNDMRARNAQKASSKSRPAHPTQPPQSVKPETSELTPSGFFNPESDAEHRASERANWTSNTWVDRAINRAVDNLQIAASKTPTAQISQLAAPAPADPSGGLTNEQAELLRALQSGEVDSFQGQVVPPTPPPAPIDPRVEAAVKAVGDQYRARDLNPMDPALSSKFQMDVDRFLAHQPGPQWQAPVHPLPLGQAPGFGEVALNALAGPGGLVGPPLPPDLAQNAVTYAPTREAERYAQTQQTTANLQEPLWTLAGGGSGAIRPTLPPPPPARVAPLSAPGQFPTAPGRRSLDGANAGSNTSNTPAPADPAASLLTPPTPAPAPSPAPARTMAKRKPPEPPKEAPKTKAAPKAESKPAPKKTAELEELQAVIDEKLGKLKRLKGMLDGQHHARAITETQYKAGIEKINDLFTKLLR